ncbi:hypothetical protein OPV22_026782 [Ensete ventricosum]|uniref:AP2/ERF domain-containing protein n=1 Tax=Ensete ventricosum TaxID=4639 RepID=A0AAV8PY05_ENSVE|nr:hypothetical protein OPV22_026782 [Ensete ventricosum]
MRKWRKWVAEVRFPNSRHRLWLGSYPTPEMAARAYDAVVYCLRGPGAELNFPSRPPNIPSADKLSRYEIREAEGAGEQAAGPDAGSSGSGATSEQPAEPSSSVPILDNATTVFLQMWRIHALYRILYVFLSSSLAATEEKTTSLVVCC